MDNSERPEHLGPMARSLIETFVDLTLPQQRRVFAMLREILETNEQAESDVDSRTSIVDSNTSPG
ncbi:MAG: hypothetical protein M3Y74_23050 [Chloroflexota bacterium]|nr:hypothetical protein [Chloroflexota bacterium]